MSMVLYRGKMMLENERERRLVLARIRDARWAAAHPYKDRPKLSERRLKLMRESRARWRRNNPEKNRKIQKSFLSKWKEGNREHIRAYDRNFYKKVKERKSGIFNERSRQRKAARFGATPLWCDRDAVREIYKKAKEISVKTGVIHHVDHIVPLRNKLVCGLHVPANLRIIPSVENLRKSNRLMEI